MPDEMSTPMEPNISTPMDPHMSTPMEAPDGGMREGGHLYVQTNEVRNVVTHYRRSPDGTITEVERISHRRLRVRGFQGDQWPGEGAERI